MSLYICAKFDVYRTFRLGDMEIAHFRHGQTDRQP